MASSNEAKSSNAAQANLSDFQGVSGAGLDALFESSSATNSSSAVKQGSNSNVTNGSTVTISNSTLASLIEAVLGQSSSSVKDNTTGSSASVKGDHASDAKSSASASSATSSNAKSATSSNASSSSTVSASSSTVTSASAEANSFFAKEGFTGYINTPQPPISGAAVASNAYSSSIDTFKANQTSAVSAYTASAKKAGYSDQQIRDNINWAQQQSSKDSTDNVNDYKSNTYQSLGSNTDNSPRGLETDAQGNLRNLYQNLKQDKTNLRATGKEAGYSNDTVNDTIHGATDYKNINDGYNWQNGPYTKDASKLPGSAEVKADAQNAKTNSALDANTKELKKLDSEIAKQQKEIKALKAKKKPKKKAKAKSKTTNKHGRNVDSLKKKVAKDHKKVTESAKDRQRDLAAGLSPEVD